MPRRPWMDITELKFSMTCMGAGDGQKNENAITWLNF